MYTCFICNGEISSKSIYYKHKVKHKQQENSKMEKEKNEVTVDEKQSDDVKKIVKKEALELIKEQIVLEEKIAIKSEIVKDEQLHSMNDDMIGDYDPDSAEIQQANAEHPEIENNQLIEFVNVGESADLDQTPHNANNRSHSSATNDSVQKYSNKVVKSYPCSICSKTLAHRQSLHKHMATHATKKKIKCNKCFKCFSHIRFLNVHVCVHSVTRKYTCQLCGKEYGSRSSFYWHRAQHYKREYRERKHEVLEGSEQEPKESEYTKVERQTQGTKEKKVEQHKCDTCSKLFRTKRMLLTHNHTHIAKKKYTCHICNRDMISKSSFYAHIAFHEEKQIKKNGGHVEIDDARNMNEENKEQQEKEVANEESNSETIGKCVEDEEKPIVGEENIKIKTDNVYLEDSKLGEFSKEENSELIEIVEHKVEIKSEPEVHDDDNDSRIYLNSSIQVLKDIQKQDNESLEDKSYKCTVCAKTFIDEESLQKHMVLHGDRKNMQCEYCWKSFARKVSLLEHMMQHKWSARKSKSRNNLGRNVVVKDETVEGMSVVVFFFILVAAVSYIGVCIFCCISDT